MSLPMKPGQARIITHDYKRNGTTCLLVALDVATGKVIGRTVGGTAQKISWPFWITLLRVSVLELQCLSSLTMSLRTSQTRLIDG